MLVTEERYFSPIPHCNIRHMPNPKARRSCLTIYGLADLPRTAKGQTKPKDHLAEAWGNNSLSPARLLSQERLTKQRTGVLMKLKTDQARLLCKITIPTRQGNNNNNLHARTHDNARRYVIGEYTPVPAARALSRWIGTETREVSDPSCSVWSHAGRILAEG